MKGRFIALLTLGLVLAGCNSKLIKVTEGNCACSRVAFPSGSSESIFCERQATEDACRRKCQAAVVLDVERKTSWYGANNEKGGCTTRQLDTEGLLTGLTAGLGKKSPDNQKEDAPAEPQAPSIVTTSLLNFFKGNPWDGRAQPAYPLVAVTIRDWSDSNCYVATAVIWHTAKKPEAIPAFSACHDPSQVSLTMAGNDGYRREMFERQLATANHTGNVRTTGPKPPISGTPRDPAFMNKRGMTQFIAELVTVTGWTFGGGVRFWITGYEPVPANP